MSKARELELAGGKREAAVASHANAWGRYMKAHAASRAAWSKGERLPYRVAQAFIRESASVGRAQDRLDEIDSLIGRLEKRSY